MLSGLEHLIRLSSQMCKTVQKGGVVFLDALLWLPGKLLAPIFQPVTDMLDALEAAQIED